MADSNPSRQTRLVEQLFVKHVATIRGIHRGLPARFRPGRGRAPGVLSDRGGQGRRLPRGFGLSRLGHGHCPVQGAGVVPPAVAEHPLALARGDRLAGCAEAPADDPAGEAEVLLRECMEELAARAREVIDLRYGEGCKPAEIARRLGWTPESVYVALSRACTLLRDCIERKNKQQEHDM